MPISTLTCCIDLNLDLDLGLDLYHYILLDIDADLDIDPGCACGTRLEMMCVEWLPGLGKYVNVKKGFLKSSPD